MSDPLQSELQDLLGVLTPAELREVDGLLKADMAQVLWRPDPDNLPQQMAYESTADVVGYGGAAGGGKTDLAIGKALTQHRVVQFFRREATELGAIVDRIAQIVGNRDGLRSQPYFWRQPSPTCEAIEFGSVPHLGDEASYQGRPKDLLVLDEAANFLERQARFLMGWVRSTDPKQRCQTLLTFNPPTSAEGQWVIAYFAPWLDDKHPNPAKSGEVRWFAVAPNGSDVEVPDGRPFRWSPEGERDYAVPANPGPAELVHIIRPQSRTFIAARVSDNRHLAGTGYVGTLQALPEPLRSQMLHGDFRAGMEDPPYQVIPTAWVDAAMARWKPKDVKGEMLGMGVDVAMGGKDSTVIARRHVDMWFDVPLAYPGSACPDGPTISGLIISAMRDRAPIHIDAFGVGAQPFAYLMQAQQQVRGINVGDKVPGETDLSGAMVFFNERSKEWWRMREALDPANETGIALPPDRRLRADLCAPLWKPVGNAIKVESRDEIKARLGRSPDFASAYILGLINTPKRPDRYDVMGNPIPRREWGKGLAAGAAEYNPIADF